MRFCIEALTAEGLHEHRGVNGFVQQVRQYGTPLFLKMNHCEPSTTESCITELACVLRPPALFSFKDLF
jgi:hypothetical protein